MNQDTEEFREKERQMSEEEERQRQILLSKMDDNFLETLVLAVRVAGHSLDFSVLQDLVEWCYRELEKEPPADITPIYQPWK